VSDAAEEARDSAEAVSTGAATVPDRRRRRRPRAASKQRRGPSIWTRMAAILLLLAGVLGLYLGGRILMSGIAGVQADIFIEDWQDRGALASERAHDVAVDAAQRAAAWFPSAHGELAEREGRIRSWRTYDRPFGDPQYEADRRATLHAYRASVTARPGWPDAWVGVARAKLELGETDAEFLRALRNALAYGAVRWEIQRDVARIGLLAWDALPMADQSRVLDAASSTVSRSRREATALLPYLEYAGMLPAFCIYQRALQREAFRICG